MKSIRNNKELKIWIKPKLLNLDKNKTESGLITSVAEDTGSLPS